MTASGSDAVEGSRRRRHWSDEDKARIVAECEALGASVSLVARRHDLNANLLFSWLLGALRATQTSLGGNRAAGPAVFRLCHSLQIPIENIGRWLLVLDLVDPSHLFLKRSHLRSEVAFENLPVTLQSRPHGLHWNSYSLQLAGVHRGLI
jgi:hypothetical protein